MGKTETFHPPTIKVKLIFVSFQFVYTFIMFLPAAFYCNYMWTHSFILIYVLTSSIYNGARYYVQVFSKIFEKRYDEKKMENDKKVENGDDYFAEFDDGDEEEQEQEQEELNNNTQNVIEEEKDDGEEEEKK